MTAVAANLNFQRLIWWSSVCSKPSQISYHFIQLSLKPFLSWFLHFIIFVFESFDFTFLSYHSKSSFQSNSCALFDQFYPNFVCDHFQWRAWPDSPFPLSFAWRNHLFGFSGQSLGSTKLLKFEWYYLFHAFNLSFPEISCSFQFISGLSFLQVLLWSNSEIGLLTAPAFVMSQFIFIWHLYLVGDSNSPSLVTQLNFHSLNVDERIIGFAYSIVRSHFQVELISLFQGIFHFQIVIFIHFWPLFVFRHLKFLPWVGPFQIFDFRIGQFIISKFSGLTVNLKFCIPALQ